MSDVTVSPEGYLKLGPGPLMAATLHEDHVDLLVYRSCFVEFSDDGGRTWQYVETRMEDRQPLGDDVMILHDRTSGTHGGRNYRATVATERLSFIAPQRPHAARTEVPNGHTT